MTTISIRNGQVQPEKYMLYNLESYINEVAYLLPENIDFVYSFLDEDISLPPDDSNTYECYHSIRDTFEETNFKKKI